MGSEREYPARPLVGVGVALLRATGPDGAASVLLIRRSRPPSAGQWSLPGGAQRLGETAEAAARRELAEETGLECGPLQLAGYMDSVHRDPDGRVRFHYTILDFCGLWEGGEPVAGSDAGDVAWMALDGGGDRGRFALTDKLAEIVAASRLRLGV